MPARITNCYLQFYFLLYYTYSINSCERTIDVTLKIKKFHFLPDCQNPGGCLVPARITNCYLQFYFLLYYTYLSNSCQRTIDVTLKIKKFNFLPGQQPLAVTWILVWCPDLVATILM